MKHFDSTLEATPQEALEAIQSGLTPKQVERAIRDHKRSAMAVLFGFSPVMVGRLGMRWGVEGRKKQTLTESSNQD